MWTLPDFGTFVGMMRGHLFYKFPTTAAVGALTIVPTTAVLCYYVYYKHNNQNNYYDSYNYFLIHGFPFCAYGLVAAMRQPRNRFALVSWCRTALYECDPLGYLDVG